MADRKAMSSVEHRAGRSLNGSCCQLARHGVLRVLALLARKATVEIGWPHNGHCQAKALGRQNRTPLLNELLVGLAHWSDVAVQGAMMGTGWRRRCEGGVSRRVSSLPEPLEESDTP